MSNLLPWLTKRRELFYQGEALKNSIDSFLKMVDDGAKVIEFDKAIIVLEDYGFDGNYRQWLLFDKFSREVVRAIDKVAKDYKEFDLYASTHDRRIKDLLLRMEYTQYDQDDHDYWLVKQKVQNGL